MWDSTQYLRFGGERGRPFFDLLARVSVETPGYIADLGCGPGNLTVTLAERWPSAIVTGVDSSQEMIDAARRAHDAPGLSFMRDDIRYWKPQALPDLIVSNAALQWVPEHRELVTEWAGWLPAGGWLAFQVPGNFDQPSHAIMREMASSSRWRPLLRDVNLTRQSADPAEYAELLAEAGCEVDAWETTYLHILRGENPVVEWYKGTGLVPVLAVLDAGQTADFLAEYGARIGAAYPPRPFGTVFPFRRVFAVARRSA
jgi:trans-aconitate 2-methyltransferase